MNQTLIGQLAWLNMVASLVSCFVTNITKAQQGTIDDFIKIVFNHGHILLKTIIIYWLKRQVVTNQFFSELFTTQKRISTWCHRK